VAVETPQGMRAFAFVITDDTDEFDENTLLAHCAAGMAAFKVPVGVQRLVRFPVTESANGVKIQRSRLREMAADHLKSS
jgi:fatty-acyl-CoA synthase